MSPDRYMMSQMALTFALNIVALFVLGLVLGRGVGWAIWGHGRIKR